MRQRIALFLGFIALTTVGGIATYSVTRGQLPALPSPPDSVKPAVYTPALGAPAAGVAKASATTPRDLSTMSEQSRKLYFSARSVELITSGDCVFDEPNRPRNRASCL